MRVIFRVIFTALAMFFAFLSANEMSGVSLGKHIVGEAEPSLACFFVGVLDAALALYFAKSAAGSLRKSRSGE